MTNRPTGGSSGYYDLPAGATQLQDLIQYRQMPHAQGEMFCALYRRKPGVDGLYNAQKVAWYALSDLAHQLRSAITTGALTTDQADEALASMSVLIDQAEDRLLQLRALFERAGHTPPCAIAADCDPRADAVGEAWWVNPEAYWWVD